MKAVRGAREEWQILRRPRDSSILGIEFEGLEGGQLRIVHSNCRWDIQREECEIGAGLVDEAYVRWHL